MLAQFQGGNVIASDPVYRQLEIANECGTGASVNPLKEDLTAHLQHFHNLPW